MYKKAARNIKPEILYEKLQPQHLSIIAAKIDHSWKLKYMLLLTRTEVEDIMRSYDDPVEQRL